MKIILKYILNSVKERKLRTLVMLLSVTLSTTLLFVSFGIGASYESAQRKMAIGYAGEARIAVTHRQTDDTAWIVFQFYNLIPNLNVEENIMLPVLLDGKDMKAYKRKLNEILNVVGLTERRKHTPRELSGGQLGIQN